ncbi:MAG: hypothetical protein AAGD01_00620 [Acidobacteriota bacterium]
MRPIRFSSGDLHHLHHLLCCVAAALLLISLAAPAHAGRNVAEWDQELAEVREKLHEQDYKKAKKLCRSLLKDFDFWIFDGPAANRLLGQTLAFRAVAELGLGHPEDAVWDFTVAQAIYPELLAEHLPAVGAGGEALQQAVEKHQEELDGLVVPENCDSVAPPRGSRSKAPEIPMALYERFRAEMGTVVVQLYINAEGTPEAFLLPEPPRFPTAAISIAEFMREAEFRPASCDGESVPSHYQISYDFSVIRR